MAIVNLGDRGLSNGDDLGPYLADHFRPGNQVVIPAGSYWLSDWPRRYRDLSGDMELIGDGAVSIDMGDGYHKPLQVRRHGGLFALRNLTFRGKGDSGTGRGQFCGVGAAAGGTIEFQNCHWPDGTQEGSDGHCIYVTKAHAGDVLVQDCLIENYADNAIYGSQPHLGGGGTVRVEHCYLRQNNISNVRLGSTGSYVRDSVLWATGGAPAADGGAYRERCVNHNEDGDVLVENCEIVSEGAGRNWTLNSGGGTLELRDNRIRRDAGTLFKDTGDATAVTGSGNHVTGADGTLPGGVVACADAGCDQPSTTWSPTPAPVPGDGSNGGSNGDSGPDVPDDAVKLEVVGQSASDQCEWSLTIADGQIEAVESWEDHDTQVSDTEAEGILFNGTDVVWYTGCIEAFAWTEPAPDVRRDGQAVALSDVVECPPQEEPPDGNGGQDSAAIAAIVGLGVAAAAARRYLRER